MKKFIVKITLLMLMIYGIIVGTNYIVDPANLFTDELIEDAVSKLNLGKTIEFYGDFDEGIFQKKMIEKLKKPPKTVIIGSSQIMYANWEHANHYVGYLSSANMGDYFGMVGILEDMDKMPEHIVFGVDPWAFMFNHTGASHESVRKYAEIAYAKIKNKKYNENNIDEPYMSKISELFSFPYFQSSIWAVRTNGAAVYINGNRNKVKIAENDEIGDIAKLKPNGQGIMSKSLLHTVEENDNEVLSAIKHNAIYKFGKSLKHLDINNFNEFVELIKYLQNNGVIVEIYLPSKYPSLYQYLVSNEEYGAVEELEREIREKIGGGYGNYHTWLL